MLSFLILIQLDIYFNNRHIRRDLGVSTKTRKKMDLLVYLIGVLVAFFIGYLIGNKQLEVMTEENK